MKKLESTFLNMTLVMTLITLFSAGILSYVYGATKDTIAEQKQAKKEQAIRDVLPKNDEIGELEIVEGLSVYRAFLGGAFVGAAVESAPMGGYSSEIKVMVGFNADGTINTYSVLSQAETPGLGTKMVDWFKTKSSIESLAPSKENLTVSKDGGKIDAITAATISSRAFLGCVQSAANAFAALQVGDVVDEHVVEVPTDSVSLSNEKVATIDTLTINQ